MFDASQQGALGPRKTRVNALSFSFRWCARCAEVSVDDLVEDGFRPTSPAAITFWIRTRTSGALVIEDRLHAKAVPKAGSVLAVNEISVIIQARLSAPFAAPRGSGDTDPAGNGNCDRSLRTAEAGQGEEFRTGINDRKVGLAARPRRRDIRNRPTICRNMNIRTPYRDAPDCV